MLGGFGDILQRRLVVGVEVRVLRLVLQRPLVRSVLGDLRSARRSRSRPRSWEERLQRREAEVCRHLLRIRASEPTEDDRERRMDLQYCGGSWGVDRTGRCPRPAGSRRPYTYESRRNLGACAIEAQHRVGCKKMLPARAYSILWRTRHGRFLGERSGAAGNALCRQPNHTKIGPPGRLRGAHWLSGGWAELESAESRSVGV